MKNIRFNEGAVEVEYMPGDWAQKTANELGTLTRRPIIVRPHPNNDPPRRALAADLENAWACVIWSTSAGVEALVRGIPVISMAPNWICRGAAGRTLKSVETPFFSDESRLDALRRLAWAQWHVDEIEAGIPFRTLCGGPVTLAGG